DRVHKNGAKFDYEKAKWFNHEWIKRLPATAYSDLVLPLFRANGITIPEAALIRPAADIPILPDVSLDPLGEVTGTPMLDIEALGVQPVPEPQPSRFEKTLDLVKDRCTTLPDFVGQATFFFQAPKTIDLDAVKPKWTPAKQQFFVELIRQL